MQRRSFLKSAAGAGVGALAASRLIQVADVEIEIAPDKPGPVINPHLYGHFIEHLGGVIYDGVWVGRNSKVPNVDGIRKQFIEDMNRICAGRAGASPTVTIGATASALRPGVPGLTIFGSIGCHPAGTRRRPTSSA